MRRVSRKRASLNRKVKPIRDQYRWEFQQCQVPWCKAKATDLHEISRGAARGSSLGVRAALLHLCRFDHQQMDVLPVAGQLAIKLLSDPVGYDRRAVNVLRGRQPEAITAEEVDFWVKALQESEPCGKDRPWCRDRTQATQGVNGTEATTFVGPQVSKDGRTQESIPAPGPEAEQENPG